jgi:hypothetical protein
MTPVPSSQLREPSPRTAPAVVPHFADTGCAQYGHLCRVTPNGSAVGHQRPGSTSASWVVAVPRNRLTVDHRSDRYLQRQIVSSNQPQLQSAWDCTTFRRPQSTHSDRNAAVARARRCVWLRGIVCSVAAQPSGAVPSFTRRPGIRSLPCAVAGGRPNDASGPVPAARLTPQRSCPAT